MTVFVAGTTAVKAGTACVFFWRGPRRRRQGRHVFLLAGSTAEAIFGTAEISFGTAEAIFGTAEAIFGTAKASFGTEEVSFGTAEVIFGTAEDIFWYGGGYTTSATRSTSGQTSAPPLW